MKKIRVNEAEANEFGFQESLCFSTAEQAPVKEKPKTNNLTQIEHDWPLGELTEINCQQEEDALYVLLPTLAKLCAERRWITLISPPHNIDQKLFALFGIDISRVLLIHPKTEREGVDVMNKALKHGTSDVAIFWSANTPNRLLAQWRKSVKQGKSTGIWINTSAKQSESRSIALSIELESDSDCILSIRKKRFGLDIKNIEKTLISKQFISNLLNKEMISIVTTNMRN